MTDYQPLQIKISSDNDTTRTILGKRKKSCLRRSSSVPPRINVTGEKEEEDGGMIPRPSSSMSVRFSPEPPQIYEYPPAMTDSKPEVDHSQRGPVLALPWHPA